MSTAIQELLKKEALAVKARTNAINEAEILELKAKQLRAEAAKPINLNFAKAAAIDKASRLDKFAAAMKKGKQDDAHQLLTAAGYGRGMHNAVTCVATYGHKGKPGYILKIKGDSFSVMNGQDVKVAPLPLSDLKAYLGIK